MNRLLLSSIAILAACASCGDEPMPEQPPHTGSSGTTGTSTPDLIAGHELTHDAVGPWTVRAVRRAEISAPDGEAASARATRRDEGLAGEDYSLAPSEAGPEAVMTLSSAAPRAAGPATPPPSSAAPGARRETAMLEEAELADTAMFDRDAEASVSNSRNAAPLRAGSTDDNEDYAAFVAWLAEQSQHDGLKGRYMPMDVSDRRAIRVVDATGHPVPGARVQVVDESHDRVAWRGTTLGDGLLPFYPALASAEGELDTVLIEARLGDRVARAQWNLEGAVCDVVFPDAPQTGAEVSLDVVFVIDTTGSMSDEIARIKHTLADVTARLDGLDREFDLRYGAVLYRDITDDYVTKAHPFTDDLAAFDAALQEIQASGGGDSPESLNQGLAVAVHDMDWREGAARLVFLIADAPPHLDYENDIDYATTAQEAVARGIRIHTVAASGLDEAGSLCFRQIAQLTRGKFVFIEYGGDVVASGAAHGVTQTGPANNLDGILFACIRDEIAGWGRTSE